MAAYSWILALAIFQIASSQGPPEFLLNLPENCRQPPRINKPHKCCEVPMFFEKSEMADCGFGNYAEGEDFKHGPPDCSKQICIMKKHNLVKEDDKVDFEQLKKFLDNYAETNPDFKSAIDMAKDCVTEDVHGPPHICVADRIVHCIGITVMTHCPDANWQQTDDCKALKDHMEECKDFFMKKN